MTDVNDYIDPNEEIEKRIVEFYYKKVKEPAVDWFLSFMKFITDRLIYLESQGGVISGQNWFLLQHLGGELVLEYDEYLELTKQMKEFGPHKTHAYVKEDGKFHIWMEKIESEQEGLNKLFGGNVEIKDDPSENIQT